MCPAPLKNSTSIETSKNEVKKESKFSGVISALCILNSDFSSYCMPQRLAAILALLVFSVCLVIGGLETGNTFTTTVARALGAMAGTFVVGLLLGSMGQKMLDENLKPMLKDSEADKELKGKKPTSGR